MLGACRRIGIGALFEEAWTDGLSRSLKMEQLSGTETTDMEADFLLHFSILAFIASLTFGLDSAAMASTERQEFAASNSNWARLAWALRRRRYGNSERLLD